MVGLSGGLGLWVCVLGWCGKVGWCGVVSVLPASVCCCGFPALGGFCWLLRYRFLGWELSVLVVMVVLQVAYGGFLACFCF